MTTADSTPGSRGLLDIPVLRDLTRKELWFLVSVLLVGFFLRWYDLDNRPVFHDESLHAQYGKYFWDAPDAHFYEYNPMLHGPMIYNVYRLVYAIFGPSTWAARFPMALMGSVFVLLPLLFRRYMTKSSFLFLTTAVALSPTLIYWSRFAREDYYVVTGLMLMLYGVVLASPRFKGFFVFLGLTIQFCTKENSFVHVAIFLGYLFYDWIFVWARSNEPRALILRAIHTAALAVFFLALTVAIRDFGQDGGTAWLVIAVGMFLYEALFNLAIPPSASATSQSVSTVTKRVVAFLFLAIFGWTMVSVEYPNSTVPSAPQVFAPDSEEAAKQRPDDRVVALAKVGVTAAVSLLFFVIVFEWLVALPREKSRLFVAQLFVKLSVLALLGLALNLSNVYVGLEAGYVYVTVLLAFFVLGILFNMQSLSERPMAPLSPLLWAAALVAGTLAQILALRYLGVSGAFLSATDLKVYFVVVAALAVFEALFNRLLLDDSLEPCLASRIAKNVSQYRIELAVGMIPSLCIYIYLYSAGFRNGKGIIDALFRESLGYWWHHHSIERIKGPFLFHFYVFGWYELIFTLAFLVHLAHAYCSNGRAMRLIGLFSLAIIMAAGIYHFDATISVEQTKLWKIFKLKDFMDVIGLVVIGVHSVTITTFHILRGEKTLAMWAYLFMAMFGTYSYLGEKVPWLSTYGLVPGIVYLILYFESYIVRRRDTVFQTYPFARTLGWIGGVSIVLGMIFIVEEGLMTDQLVEYVRAFAQRQDISKLPFRATVIANSGFLVFGLVFVLGAFLERRYKLVGTHNIAAAALCFMALYNARSAILTNFVYPGEGREYIGQVHTTPEFHRVISRLRWDIQSTAAGTRPDVCVDGDAIWPITWYLRDLPEYRFNVSEKDRLACSYMFLDWKENQTDMPPGFTVRRINLRGWYLPDFNNMTLKKFLNYSLNHTTWNEPGYTYVNVLKNISKP